MTDRNSSVRNAGNGRAVFPVSQSLSSHPGLLSWGSVVIKRLVVSSEELLIMLGILVVLLLVRLGLVATIQQMTVAGIFDEGDTHYAEVFRQAVEDVNNNR